MRLTLAFLGLVALANAAAIASPKATDNDEAEVNEKSLSTRRVGEVQCGYLVNGPGWDRFLKVHYAFTKIWAQTPAGFCVAYNNWACVQCDGAYLAFEPQLLYGQVTCRTSAQFGEAATKFNIPAQQGQSACTVLDGVPYNWNGMWVFSDIYDGNPALENGCLERC